MRDEQEELRRKLDEVVGDRFDERGERWRARWLRHGIPRWIAGALIAVAMVSLVWFVLDRQLKAAHHAPDPARNPVIIRILPAK